MNLKILQRALLILVIILSIYNLLCTFNVIPSEYAINIIVILSLLLLALALNHRKEE